MYIYKTTNLKNGKFYIGKSEKEVYENPEYLGSGKILKLALKKYGKDNFTKDILFQTDDVDLLNEAEILFISLYKNLFQTECYNIANGGDGGNSFRYCSEEELNEFKIKMSEITSGQNNPFYGKHHTEETKSIISEKKTGFKHSEEFKEKCSERMMGNTINVGRKHTDETLLLKSKLFSGENNPMYGKKHSDETLDKISEGIRKSKELKFTCEYCGKKTDKGNHNRWHGDNCKHNPNITENALNKRKPWNKTN